MTNRKQALEALRDKVKAGDAARATITAGLFQDKADLLTFFAGTKTQKIDLLERLISETPDTPKGDTP